MTKLANVRKMLDRREADALFLTGQYDVQWLTGFSGDSSQVLVTRKHAWFFTDARYTEQAQKEMKGFTLVETTARDRLASIGDLLEQEDVHTLAIDECAVTLDCMRRYEQSWFVKYAYVSDEIDRLRSVKSAAEVQRMRAGAAITEKAFMHLLSLIKPGISERDLLAELVYFFQKQGAEPSFPPILASGTNSSMPHAGVTDRKLVQGDFLTMDFGCRYQGMCTDFTRTIALSGVDQTQKLIYNTVMTAQKAAESRLRAGIVCCEADAAARSIINEAGFGEYFGHGTGHGVGVEIHEQPRLAQNAEDDLVAGMVVTVEPGIYLPGQYGVRIEDMLLVTQAGCENFYTTEKELILI